MAVPLGNGSILQFIYSVYENCIGCGNGEKNCPACVRACPTGAALRISPENFLDYAGVNP